MKADPDDHPRLKHNQRTAWGPFLAIGFSVAALMGFSMLYASGWGITVDLKKLTDSVKINDKRQKPSVVLPPKILSNDTPTRTKQQFREDEDTRYIQPAGMRPLNYDLQVKLFKKIFIQHPNCTPNNMKWTQMDCSNFKARAMKRFMNEWNKNAYWNGKEITNNTKANKIVNSELNI